MNGINKNKVYEILGAKGALAADNTLLKEEIGLDSISMVKVLTQLCGEFNIDILSITDTDLMQLETVKDVLNLILKHHEI